MDSVYCTAVRSCLDYLCQRFSSRLVTKPVRSETYKQNGCRVPTMVLSEAHGLSLFRVIREGLGSSVRLRARSTQHLCTSMPIYCVVFSECGFFDIHSRRHQVPHHHSSGS